MFTSNLGQIVLGVAAAAGIVFAAVLITPPDRTAQEAEPVSLVPEAVAEVPEAPVAEQSAQVVETAPKPPVVDTLRVDADGEVLIAGRAEPLTEVAVVVAGQEVARATADASGGFVTFASLPPSAQTRSMILIADPDAAAVKSDQSYFIAPIAAPATDVAALDVAEPEVSPTVEGDEPTVPEVVVALEQPETPTQEPVAENPTTEVAEANTPSTESQMESGEVSTDPEPVTAAEVADTAPTQEPFAPAIIVADQDGVRVVQPAGAAPEVLDNVALDTITYDPTGEVLIAGRAQGDGFVTVYLDNQPITTSRIAEGGGWRTDLPDIDTGVYTLRVDELDAEGTVVSRIETPFKREEPEVVAEVLADQTDDPSFEVAMTTVQPGATLWAIAESRFGDGIRYVEVFEANRDRIKNPDLIYPGQVFRVPEADE